METAVPEYSSQSPPDVLDWMIETSWVQEAPADPGEVPPTVVAPGPSAEILVCYGDPFERLEGDRRVREPAVLVAGPRTRQVRVRATGRTGMVIVRLRPWALPLLFHHGAQVVVDAHLDFGELVGGFDSGALVQQIAEQPSPRDRIELLQSRLVACLRDRRPDRMVVEAIAAINSACGALSVAALASRVGLSDRQLRRRFVRAVGVGPKRFARMVRFQKAVGLLRHGTAWGDVVERCGYFDQSHLDGELAEMAGTTPRALARRPVTPLGAFYNCADLHELHGTSYL